MNIIFGASGQVGSNIVKQLTNWDLPVRAVVRNPDLVFNKKIEVKAADLLDLQSLKNSLEGGTTAFVLTPENPASADILVETKQIIENLKEAIRASKIQRIVGLSCIGAHLPAGTGNILMSRMLECGFAELDIQKVFIRASYFYSNWLNFLDTARQYGGLPSFFPADLKIEMHSPVDLAGFTAEVIGNDNFSGCEGIFELVGPEKYSPRDIAESLTVLLGKKVEVQVIPKHKWRESLSSAGFSPDAATNLIEMTSAVIDNITLPERQGLVHHLKTSLPEYLSGQLL